MLKHSEIRFDFAIEYEICLGITSTQSCWFNRKLRGHCLLPLGLSFSALKQEN